MNEAAKLNSGFAVRYLSTGAAFIIMAVLLFVYKNYTGYSDVEFYRTVYNCTVETRTETVRTYSTRHRRYTTYYYVKVINEEENLKITTSGSKEYYRHFLLMDQRENNTVTFYKDKYGKAFPVYQINCNEKEAERIYRQINPPIMWYMLFGILAMIGAVFVIIGLGSNRVAARYMNKNDPYNFKRRTDRTSSQMSAELDELIKNKNSVYNSEDSGEKLTQAQKQELLDEFDELAKQDKYKYKSYDDFLTDDKEVWRCS